MRIGTWNLDARWSSRHAAALVAADCDIWLLAEVMGDSGLGGYAIHLSEAKMARGQHYAAVMSRLALAAVPGPHPASAAAGINDLTVCASVLPWALNDSQQIWGDGDQGTRTELAVDAILAGLKDRTVIWGGDFNHAIEGPTQHSGSRSGRAAIRRAVASLALLTPTATLSHRLPGICSIDHIGLPQSWAVTESRMVAQPSALSDHSMYVVTATASD